MRTLDVIRSMLGRPRSALITLGVACGLAVATAWYHLVPHHDPVRARAWQEVAPRIEQAEEETLGEAEASAAMVESFFAERAQGADAFAADVLSLRGKWAFVQDYFESGSQERYLEECFERHLFRPDELKAVIESAVSRYVSETQGRENQLLVEIRADLADGDLAAPDFLPELGSEEEFRLAYASMLEKILPIVSRDVGATATRELVAFVGAEIAARIAMEIGVSLATRLGVSGGILGAGAYSGAFTFGVGLVAAFFVDMALDWVIRQAGYDPEGEVAAQVRSALWRLESLIVDGDQDARSRYEELRATVGESWWASERDSAQAEAEAIESGGGLGLRHQLRRVDEMRSLLREAALRALILEGGAL